MIFLGFRVGPPPEVFDNKTIERHKDGATMFKEPARERNLQEICGTDREPLLQNDLV